MNNVDRVVGCVCLVIFGAVIGVELTAALRPNRVVYLETKEPPRISYRIDCSAEGREACKVQSRHERISLGGKP